MDKINWSLILTWISLTIIGLLAIYSATQGPVSQFLPEHVQDNFIKQLIWVAISILILIGIHFIDPRTFQDASYLLYAIGIILMVLTLIFGIEVNGARSWIVLGPLRFQTSELMKIFTILAVANYLSSRRDISAENLRPALIAVFLILLPATLVLMQNDMGTALVFLALIPFMLFWSGLPYGISLFMISPAIIGYLSIIEWYYGIIAVTVITILIFFIQKRNWLSFATLFIGILIVIGMQIALTQVLQPHQRARIEAFTNPSFDPQGAGWNVIQAKTAIGSGGLYGKGFMQGTQTQLRFLPEQWTDFIYCVIGEEFGFVGTMAVVLLFIFMILKLLNMAGNHKHPFAQLFIVGVTAIYFIHFFINVGSATALLPVIGLPLPFISYGGSAFLSNTLMLAICLNLDFYKRQFTVFMS